MWQAVEVGNEASDLHVSSASVPQFQLLTLLPTGHPLQTTLMDVLAGRKTGGVISGEVHVNGELSSEGSGAAQEAFDRPAWSHCTAP